MANMQQSMVQFSMPDAQVFDLEGFLKRIGGDMEIAEAVVDGFLSDIPQRFSKLSQAMAVKDPKGVRQHAHAIHGAAVNIGARHLGEILRTMEEEARMGNLNSIESLMPEAAVRLGTLEKVIREWREK